MSLRLTCESCGYVGRYKTRPLADHHFRKHSCEATRERRARAQRRLAREQAEGAKHDCQCKTANHQHGTSTAYVVDKCRCRACRDANTAKAAERARAQLYGRYNQLIDATPARDHLQHLQRQGMGPKRVSEVSGIAHGSISAILYGKPASDPKEVRAPRKRITRGLHDRIMAVRLDLADGARVDGTGTTRRLQALVAIGWPQARLAARLNMSGTNLGGLVHGHRDTTHAVAQAVRALYDDLWDQPLPGTSGNRARAYAARHGWLPPMAHDDDTIDDPNAGPASADDGDEDWFLTDLEHLMPCTEWEAAAAFKIKPSTIEQRLRRVGRTDLWHQLRARQDGAA